MRSPPDAQSGCFVGSKNDASEVAGGVDAVGSALADPHTREGEEVSEVRLRRHRYAAAAVTAVALFVIVIVALAGCSLDKMNEPFHDAPRGATNSSPADIIEMPDGFSNAATKCDHGNRVYVVFHQDNPYGAIAVVPNDPTCAGR